MAITYLYTWLGTFDTDNLLQKGYRPNQLLVLEDAPFPVFIQPDLYRNLATRSLLLGVFGTNCPYSIARKNFTEWRRREHRLTLDWGTNYYHYGFEALYKQFLDGDYVLLKL